MAYIGQNADGNFTTSVSKDTFSGNGSTTAFTLSEGATTNTVDVFVENIRQEPTTAYTVDGTTLTFTAAPVTGTNNIYVVNRGPIQLSASHPAAQALSAFSATITNDLTVDTNTLFVDSTNNRVGVGTVSPSSILHLSASNDPIITLTDTGASASADITGSNGNLRLNSQTATLFDMADSEIARFDNSGNLFVGKTSGAIGTAGSAFYNYGLVESVRDGNKVMSLNRLSSVGDIVDLKKDGTTVGLLGVDAGGFYVDGEASHTGLRFKGGAVTPRLNGAQADNTVGLGNASERFSDLYLGGGAYIGGTGSANYLDDYEEGTFTPTYTGSSSNPTVTYDSQTSGSYVKIGRQVIAKIILRTDASSGGSGNLYISGLPFTASAASGSRAGTLNVGYSSSFVTENPQAGYISGGSTFVILSTNSDGDDSRSALNNALGTTNLATGTNGNFIMSTLIYEV